MTGVRQHGSGPGPAALRWTGKHWKQQACLSLLYQPATDVHDGTGLSWLGAVTLSLQEVQLLSMNILGDGWPEVRRGRWVGETK